MKRSIVGVVLLCMLAATGLGVLPACGTLLTDGQFDPVKFSALVVAAREARDFYLESRTILESLEAAEPTAEESAAERQANIDEAQARLDRAFVEFERWRDLLIGQGPAGQAEAKSLEQPLLE